jgi:NAD-dependent SIR2 family protein deacetylase
MENNNEKVKNENECPHIKDLMSLEEIRNLQNKSVCSICELETEKIILCLNCGKFFCEENHIKKHHEETNHVISFNKKNLKINCSKCDKLTKNQIKFYYQYLYEKILLNSEFGLFTNEEIKEIKYKKFISLLKENKFENVIFMVGAGISTSAGIPDFRSESGLFKQLQSKYNLTRPEEFFDITLFMKNPYLFYEFTKLFDLSSRKPTLTHKFISYMLNKNHAKYLFTQNIDGLEDKAKIPSDKIIFAHGTFSHAHCPKCKKEIDINVMNEYIQKGEILYCEECKVPCKPNVVFYGENLPTIFFEKLSECKDCDLVIIMGTSLVVQPFASIPYYVKKKDSWKIAINKELIGNFDYDFLTDNSLFLCGNTDDISWKIIKDCEWENDYLLFAKENFGDDVVDLEKQMEMLSIQDKQEKKNEDKENKSEDKIKEKEN